ncbi:MAG: hypothetical protein JWO08_4323, partial [Verrucomicrobiaceae bacterium]|nr:hypothetical protein [Verrucomicrobiaceae bacterium]
STLGGTVLTITGTGFTGATSVTIGGTAATGLSVTNDTTLTCTTPAHAAGTASVLVTTSGGTNTANSLYTYVQPAPTVTAINPSSGSTLGSTNVTLFGTNFTGATGVTIGGSAATNLVVTDDTTLTCTAPAGAAGTASVLVTTTGGTNAVNTLYTYVAPPVIVANPGNQGVTVGQSAAFTAAATGSPAPTVQWQVSTNGGTTFNNIVGATDPTYIFVTTLADSTKKYRAVFTNAGGSVATTAGTVTVYSRPVGIRPGFNTTSFGRSDDGSTGLVSLGFTINLFGSSYAACYVNNNGNLTFDAANPGYTANPIVNSAIKIIAPFWGDVDTRGTASGIMAYGAGTVNGHLAWGATWDHVGYYSSQTDRLDTFQVILIDRSDLAPGAFDMEFNYGPIKWEYGSASGGAPPRAGYSNGSTVSYELPGSGVLGAFLDGGPNSLSAVSGTLIFSSVSGVITPTDVTPDVTSSTAVQTTAVTTVTINGSGFATTNANNSVLFNLGAAGSVTSSTTTQLIVTFSVRPVAGNLMAVVTSNGQSSGGAEQVATIVPPISVTTTAVDVPASAVPGSAIAGASWASIRSGMVMSGSGALAYRGHMALTGGITVNDFQGIWKTPDGSVASASLVARSGVTQEPSVGALFDILPVNPIINNAAQASFVGLLRVNSGSPAVAISSDSGVWSELGTGGLKKLLREGDTLSGSTVGTVAPSTWITGSANAAAFGVKLGTGSALVRVDVAGTTVTPSIVAKEGDTVPVKTGGDAGSFDSLVGNTSDPRMDAAGNVAFLSTVVPAGQGIWYKTVAGALTAVANTNQTAPGLGGPVFDGFERPSLSGDGSTIAFRAFLSGANGQSVFKGTPAAPVAIAKSNDTAITGVPAGRKLWSVWSPFTNNTGKVAFRVSLVDTATSANESRAILTDADGTLKVIAKVGDTAPGLGTQTFANFDHPIIGDGNQCAFVAGTSGGTVGLFRQTAGGGPLVLVTMVGDVVNVAAGGSETIAQMVVPGTATDDRKYETKVIDATGHILVHVTYASGRTGIFLSAQ